MASIQYQRGNIFDSKAHVIVNTVNCDGYMGKGLALAFKQRFPDMFPVYQQECKTGKLRIGRPTLYQESTPWILNFPTKYHWRFPSKLDYLEKGLEFLVANYTKVGIKSIAFPKLGTQNGKLSWDEVGPLMANYLSQLDIDVYIYITEEDTEYQTAENISIQHATVNETNSICLYSSANSSREVQSIAEESTNVAINQNGPERKNSSTKRKDNNHPQFAQATLPW